MGETRPSVWNAWEAYRRSNRTRWRGPGGWVGAARGESGRDEEGTPQSALRVDHALQVKNESYEVSLDEILKVCSMDRAACVLL